MCVWSQKGKTIDLALDPHEKLHSVSLLKRAILHAVAALEINKSAVEASIFKV